MWTKALLPAVESHSKTDTVDGTKPISGVKRKRADYENGDSVTPTQLAGLETRSTSGVDAQNVEVLAQNVAVNNPRLSISRHPTFTSVPNSGDPPLCTTELCLMNRALNQVGYRYYPAGLSEPGSTIAYRTIESRPTSVRVSWEDRSPFVRVSEDGLDLGGQGGFRSARANVPIREGKWYMEVKILKASEDELGQKGMRDGAHVRLGWGRREAPLNGPVGLDGYSYGFRDKTGEKITLSRPKPYGRPFETGDVIGLYISLPPKRAANPDDPWDPARMERHRIAIKYRGQEYWETLEIPQSKEMIALTVTKQKSNRPAEDGDTVHIPVKKSAAVKNAPGSQRKPPLRQEPKLRQLETLGCNSIISFFVNGECQGIAFNDLYDYLQLRKEPKDRDKAKKKEHVLGQHQENPFDDGTLGYYPFFSLYGDARIQLNPGPIFKFTPPDDIDALLLGSKVESEAGRQWRPIYERYQEFMQEMWDQDLVDEERAKVAVAEAALREQEELAKHTSKEKKREAAARRKAKGKALAHSSDVLKEKFDLSLDSRFGPDVDEFLISTVDSASYAESVISNDNDIQENGSPSESVINTDPSTPASYDEGEDEDEQEQEQEQDQEQEGKDTDSPVSTEAHTNLAQQDKPGNNVFV
jgi:COMPASS component BRE2